MYLSYVVYIVLAFTFLSCTPKETMPQYNILLILTDDQGYGDLAAHGNKFLETPNIDRLEGESVVFNRFYVSPVCAPTRASILTGRYHIATGTTWVTHRMEVMREEEVTLAEMLKPSGYRSGLFGKWHQGKQYPHDPIGQGFDEFFGFSEGHLNNYFDATMVDGFEEVSTQGYLPDVLTERAIAFMEKKEPFFAMLSFNTPHSPFQVPDQYFDKYKAKGLNDKDACVYGMVENIDENVGRVIAYLKQSGKLENTIVIFMTDNGPNGVRFNANMKGIKGSLDEGGVRVPFFIRIPGYSHKTVSSWAAHIDILPTLAALVNVPIPEDKEVHGKNLLPLIVENSEWKDRYFFTHHVNRTFEPIPAAIRNQQYLMTLRENHQELYDLQHDPSQKENIIANNTALATELQNLYFDWLQEMTQDGVGPPLIQVGHKEVPRVELPAPDAKRSGNVDYMGSMGWANDWFVYFHNPDDQVFWELQAVGEGTYGVFVQLTNDKPISLKWSFNKQSNTVNLQESHLAVSIPNKDRIPRKEVEEMEWPLVSLGKIVFEEGNGKFTLGLNIETDVNLQIKGVILRKITG